jgi:hypothetical protein
MSKKSSFRGPGRQALLVLILTGGLLGIAGHAAATPPTVLGELFTQVL